MNKHMNECKCFDNFKSTINDLSIGNPDDLQNKINNLRKEISFFGVPNNERNASVLVSTDKIVVKTFSPNRKSLNSSQSPSQLAKRIQVN